ncbi:MAG: T9SS type A sorting domain-containing protein [Saprospiraceae bacterium]
MRLLLLFACFTASSAFSQAYFVRFPDDLLYKQCEAANIYGEPLFYNPDSLPIAVEYWDVFPSPVPDACYKFERYWKIYKQDTYHPALPCTQVPNPTPYAIATHPANASGPVISSIDTLGNPWSATISKITPVDPAPTNFSMYWSASANCYMYRQMINLIDTIAPLVIDCHAGIPPAADTTLNDPHLWNAAYWWDPPANSQDLREGAIDLGYAAFDSCSGTNLGVRYLLYLDLDQDGVQETVINSQAPPPPGMVFFGNAANPGFSGGEPRYFDQRPDIDSLNRYRFGYDRVWNNNALVLRLRWVEGQWPDTIIFSLPQLPPGQHRIKWYTQDACGNETLCDHPFEMLGGVVATQAPQSTLLKLESNPNPFWENTTLLFDLPETGPVQLAILNATGQQVYAKTRYLPAGDNQWIIRKAEISGKSGMYWYTLKSGLSRAVGKLVLLP